MLLYVFFLGDAWETLNQKFHGFCDCSSDEIAVIKKGKVADAASFVAVGMHLIIDDFDAMDCAHLDLVLMLLNNTLDALALLSRPGTHARFASCM